MKRPLKRPLRRLMRQALRPPPRAAVWPEPGSALGFAGPARPPGNQAPARGAESDSRTWEQLSQQPHSVPAATARVCFSSPGNAKAWRSNSQPVSLSACQTVVVSSLTCPARPPMSAGWRHRRQGCQHPAAQRQQFDPLARSGHGQPRHHERMRNTSKARAEAEAEPEAEAEAKAKAKARLQAAGCPEARED